MHSVALSQQIYCESTTHRIAVQQNPQQIDLLWICCNLLWILL